MENVLIGFCVMLLSATSLAEVQSHSVTSIRRPLSCAANRSIVSGTTTTNGVTWSYSVVDGAVHLVLRRSSAVPPDTEGALVIPDLLDGKPVRDIGYGAFRNCTNLTSVTIPSGVTNIGVGAFRNCSSLESVSIPTSVRSIGESAFHGCSSLTSVSIPPSVTSIEWNTFYGCNSLTSVLIPTSVTDIDDLEFCRCSSLTEFVVADGNAAYSSLDGVLFDAERKKLIRCPIAKSGEYVIPPDVANIGERAFSRCSELISVTIPSTVTNIDCRAFDDCTNLKFVDVVSDGNVERMPVADFLKRYARLSSSNGSEMTDGIGGPSRSAGHHPGGLLSRRSQHQRTVEQDSARRAAARPDGGAGRDESNASKHELEAERAEQRRQLQVVLEKMKRARQERDAADRK